VTVPLKEAVICWPKRLLLTSRISVARNTLIGIDFAMPGLVQGKTNIVGFLCMMSPGLLSPSNPREREGVNANSAPALKRRTTSVTG